MIVPFKPKPCPGQTGQKSKPFPGGGRRGQDHVQETGPTGKSRQNKRPEGIFPLK